VSRSNKYVFALLHALVDREGHLAEAGFMLRTIVAVGLATTMIACASSQQTFGRRSSPAYSHDVVTFDELARTATGAANLYQALERVRPTFITPRMSGRPIRSTASQIDVFVNGGYAGDGSVLLTLNPSYVASVRLERRSQAFVRHGTWLRGENILYVTLLR
jgi:hypothetical protein